MATKKFFISIIIFFFHFFLHAQNVQEDLKNWMRQFSALNEELKISPDGEWIAVSKNNIEENSTLLVYQKGKQIPQFNFSDITTSQFLDNNTLYVSSLSETRLIELKSQKIQTFKNYKTAGVLPNNEGIYILEKDSTISFFNKKANKIQSWNNIAFIKKENNSLILSQHIGKEFVFFNPEKDSSTAYRSSRFPLSFYYQDDTWLIVEKDSNKKLWLTLLDNNGTKIQTIDLPGEMAPLKVSYVKTMQPSQIIIDIKNNIQRPNKDNLEIWSTHEKLLRYKLKGLPTRTYAVWDLKTNNFSTWHTAINDRHILLPNNNNSLIYNLEEKDTYTSFNFQANLFIKPHNAESRSLWAKGIADIRASKNNEYLIAHSSVDNNWHLLNTSQWTKKTLIGNLTNPIFSHDNREIYFTDDTRLIGYDIESASFKTLFEKDNVVSVRIINTQRTTEYSHLTGIHLTSLFIAKNTPVVFKAVFKNNDEAIYILNENHKIKILSPPSPVKIINFKLTENQYEGVALKEEYNKPTYIQHHSLKNNKTYQIHPFTDKDAHLLNREIVTFKTESGQNQKGILYYPINFDPTKNYPMVVFVYEEQQYKANMYLQPQMTDIGFSPRVYMDRGYFVFLPDILVENISPAGAAATRQLEWALKEIDKRPYIDKKKRALLGQSFGAYQTLLAATKPLDFATYISGASTASIIEKYYTFYDAFQVPEYARILNSQFALKLPFEQNHNLYFDNDPLYKITNVKAPILLWVGLEDKNSPPSSTKSFYLGLLKNKKTGVALFYPNADHSFVGNPESSADLTTRILQWCDYFLKDKKDVPWINNQIKKEAP